MITMQYSFALPADYDMAIIDRRVREKGRLLDNFPSLIFKAYLAACKDDPITHSRENLYAPFYLWKDDMGMNDFVCGAGFAGLVNAFGWPMIRTWPFVMANRQSLDIQTAKFATREILQLKPFTLLDKLRDEEKMLTEIAIEKEGALQALSAFEPTTPWVVSHGWCHTWVVSDPNISAKLSS